VGLHAAHSQLHRLRLAGSQAAEDGPFGIAALKPRQLLGLEFDSLTHGVLWSLLANIAAYASVSALRPPNRIEALQAEAFLPDSRAGSAALPASASGALR
jgi:hypothetical protein